MQKLSPVLMVDEGIAIVARVSQYNPSEQQGLDDVRDRINENSD